MTKLLLKADDLTKNTVMGGNIDVNHYLHIIKENQVFVIEPILGTKLYDRILADFTAQTLEGNYATLLNDYIKPILIYSVAAEFILTHSYNVANGGIFKSQPENAAPVSKSEVDFLVQNQQNKAGAYIQRMKEFLCDTNIPEYSGSQDNNFDVKPQHGFTYTGGWQL
ncbi:hypothetical protein LCGC14_1114190 [marine sediment metagenome]|uniref:Uncharacterized protein n=2 Tax=root TaxID=1 RepID=A0A831VSI4_9FLAO|nr:hypothetical protein [Pricia antarctica]